MGEFGSKCHDNKCVPGSTDSWFRWIIFIFYSKHHLKIK